MTKRKAPESPADSEPTPKAKAGLTAAAAPTKAGVTAPAAPTTEEPAAQRYVSLGVDGPAPTWPELPSATTIANGTAPPVDDVMCKIYPAWIHNLTRYLISPPAAGGEVTPLHCHLWDLPPLAIDGAAPKSESSQGGGLSSFKERWYTENCKRSLSRTHL